MVTDPSPCALVAHRRAPVQRMIRTNLEADGLQILAASTPATGLSLLQSHDVQVLVLDADLIRGEDADSAALRDHLLARPLPTLLLSWDSGDWVLARQLNDAPFLSRPDEIERISSHVRELLGMATRV